MARKRQEEPSGGNAPWMNTFADLMNLLLCFFVMLFGMSTIDSEKFENLVAAFQNSFSILPSGGSTVLDSGELITSGVSQILIFQEYYAMIEESGTGEEQQKETDIVEEYEKQSLAESEKMADNLEAALERYSIQDEVEVKYNADYVMLNMNGTLLFDSAKSELRPEAMPLVEKIGKVLEAYDKNIIEVEGHTDNVPISSAKYPNNDVLSMYRALTVANFLRANTTLNPAYIKSSGRGEYVPVADNTTPEGRAKNRRVEIRIYNIYNSDLSE